MGAWIEMFPKCFPPKLKKSHPTWVRGLKYCVRLWSVRQTKVAPHVGAWIEIKGIYQTANFSDVAPHVGAWIEIKIVCDSEAYERGRTPRGCVD